MQQTADHHNARAVPMLHPGRPIPDQRSRIDESPWQGASIIGVLAMQGDVREHSAMLLNLRCNTLRVRTTDDLTRIDALVIPGGESTSIRMLLDWHGLLGLLRERIADGMPVLGTCAGLITLARTTTGDAAPPTLDVLDVLVERNGFGRQVASFEDAVTFTDAAGPQLAGTTMEGVFIRAPRIVEVGDTVEVLATLPDGEPVAVRQGNLIGSTFHPELTGVPHMHELLVAQCREEGERGRTQ